MSFLLLLDGHAVVLDAGTGIVRLLEPSVREALRPYRHLTIFLSHYHQDHVIGLAYLPGVWPTGTVTIYAPGAPLVDADAHATLSRLIGPPFFPLALHEFPATTDIVATTGAPVRIGSCEVTFRRQRHPGGLAGIRVGDVLAYVTDTSVQDETVDFVAGTRLLLHEVWSAGNNPSDASTLRAGHSSLSGVAAIVSRARVAAVMPIHFHPERSGTEVRHLTESLERLSGVPAILPQEGCAYDIA